MYKSLPPTIASVTYEAQKLVKKFVMVLLVGQPPLLPWSSLNMILSSVPLLSLKQVTISLQRWFLKFKMVAYLFS